MSDALDFKTQYNEHWKKYHIFGRWLADPSVNDDLKVKHQYKFNDEAKILHQLSQLAVENLGRRMDLGEIEFGFYLSKTEL